MLNLIKPFETYYKDFFWKLVIIAGIYSILRKGDEVTYILSGTVLPGAGKEYKTAGIPEWVFRRVLERAVIYAQYKTGILT